MKELTSLVRLVREMSIGICLLVQGTEGYDRATARLQLCSRARCRLQNPAAQSPATCP